jgi:hypothetical protein
MKNAILFFLSLAAFIFAGCESFRSDVAEHLAPPQYQVKVVSVDQRVAYEASRAALGKMNYTFERGGPAQGIIHAIGPINTRATGRGTARQLWFDAKLSPALEGGTKVEILFSELIEDNFNKRPGEGSLLPLHDSTVYEVFFGYLDEALKTKR